MRQRNVEPLWSPVAATGGNPWQIERPENRPKQAKTVAIGCDQLRLGPHGKEGVDGSSPSEGFTKGQQMAFCVASPAFTIHSGLPRTCPQDVSPISGPASELGEQRVPMTRSTSVRGRCSVVGNEEATGEEVGEAHLRSGHRNER
jgi:hypothetical protein